MSVRNRRSASAIVIALAATAGATLLLTGCDPNGTGKAPAAPSGSASASATASAAAGAPVGAAPGSVVNGTANNGLTISNGTSTVVMNRTTVDFGTVVRDLAWNPSGSKAAFVDGSGDLVVSNPDGSGQTVVARNPGNQVWSHPTWQVTGSNQEGIAPKDNLLFAASANGSTRLDKVSATAVDGTPTVLSLNAGAGQNVQPLPQTGNTWPNGGGTAAAGTSVYENTGTGEVYIRDDYLRQMGGALAQGSEPALSPNGQDVVFVRSVDGHDHVFEEVAYARTAQDLTPNATADDTEPTWSPDGSTIAFRTPTGIDTVPVAGGASVQVSGYTGLPAYRG